MAGQWRLLVNEKADAADVAAMPSAVAEGRLAGRYIMAARTTPDTAIVQQIARRGILAGADVAVDREEAAKRGIDVAVLPRQGRGAVRPADTVPLDELMLGAGDECAAVDRAESDLAALIYTSGTTGEPKGVMLTHGNLVGECELTLGVITTGPDDSFASLVPFFHVFGLADGCIVALQRGCAVVLVPQYSPHTFIDTLEKAHPTVVLAIPTQYAHLAMAARRRKPNLTRPIRYCISGAAPLPAKLVGEFAERFGVTIVEGYGMTETTAAVTLNPVDRVKPGSIGVACPGVEIRVVDAAGRDVAPGEDGELLVKGPTVCKGYYGRPQDTSEAFDEHGFLRTGDIGRRDADGYLFITDRKKDIIIKGGYNIAPSEIEQALVQHPKVREAAVVGYRDEDLRETIRAFCVLNQKGSATAEELLAHCRSVLAAYKAPDAISIVDTLPRSLTGKVLRRLLREQTDTPADRGER